MWEVQFCTSEFTPEIQKTDVYYLYFILNIWTQQFQAPETSLLFVIVLWPQVKQTACQTLVHVASLFVPVGKLCNR
jgi:hypothetical protein